MIRSKKLRILSKCLTDKFHRSKIKLVPWNEWLINNRGLIEEKVPPIHFVIKQTLESIYETAAKFRKRNPRHTYASCRSAFETVFNRRKQNFRGYGINGRPQYAPSLTVLWWSNRFETRSPAANKSSPSLPSVTINR